VVVDVTWPSCKTQPVSSFSHVDQVCSGGPSVVRAGTAGQCGQRSAAGTPWLPKCPAGRWSNAAKKSRPHPELSGVVWQCWGPSYWQCSVRCRFTGNVVGEGHFSTWKTSQILCRRRNYVDRGRHPWRWKVWAGEGQENQRRRSGVPRNPRSTTNDQVAEILEQFRPRHDAAWIASHVETHEW